MKLNFNFKNKFIEIISPYNIKYNLYMSLKKYFKSLCYGFSVEESSLLIFYESFSIKTLLINSNNKKKLYFTKSLMLGNHGILKRSLENKTNTKIIINQKYIHIIGTNKNINILMKTIYKLHISIIDETN